MDSHCTCLAEHRTGTLPTDPSRSPWCLLEVRGPPPSPFSLSARAGRGPFGPSCLVTCICVQSQGLRVQVLSRFLTLKSRCNVGRTTENTDGAKFIFEAQFFIQIYLNIYICILSCNKATRSASLIYINEGKVLNMAWQLPLLSLVLAPTSSRPSPARAEGHSLRPRPCLKYVRVRSNDPQYN